MGDDVTFTCSTPAGPDTVFVWLHRGYDTLCTSCTGQSIDAILAEQDDLVVGSDPTLMLTNVTGYDNGGAYQCIAINDAGFEIVTATLNVRPIILNHIPSVVVKKYSPVEVECVADGYPEPEFTWTYLRTSEVFSYNSTLSFTSDASLGGYYQCNATNDVGEDADITILYVPPEIEVDPYATNVSARVEPIELSCTASGFPFPNITWVHNGTYIDELDDDITIMTNNNDDSFGTVYSNLTVYDTMISDSGDYMCIASNGFDPDAESENATVLVQDVPHAPFDLEAMNVSSRNLTLTWMRPFESNAPILGYFVFYSHPSFIMDGADVIEELMEREEMLFIDDLHPGVTYYFTVIAYNEEGNSTMSDVLFVSTLEEAPGGPPTNVTGFAISSSEIFLYWEFCEEEVRHGVITSYDILYFSDEIDEEILIEEHPDTWINLTNLSAFTNYSISVRARTEVGEGPFSDDIFIITDEDIPEPPDVPMVPSDVTSTSATLMWEAPRGGIILTYTVEYGPVEFVNEVEFSSRKRATVDDSVLRCLTSVGNNSVISVNTSNTSLTVPNLIPNSIYSYRVRATTIVGTGNFSDSQTFNTSSDAPGPVGDLQAVALDSTVISVTWEYPPCPNGLPSTYIIYYTQRDTPQSPPINTTGFIDITVPIAFASKFTIGGLTPGLYYEIYVQAVTVDGNETLFGEIDTQFLRALPEGLGPVSSLSGTAINSTAIEVQWNASPNTSTHYDVYYRRGNEAQTGDISSEGYIRERVSAGDFTTVYIINDLTPGLTYVIHVQPVVVVGDEVVLAGVIDVEISVPPVPIGPVTNLRAVVRDSRSILVQWDSPADNILTHFYIYRVEGSTPQTVPINSDGYSRVRMATQGDTNVHLIDHGVTVGRSYLIHVQGIILVDNTVVQEGEVDREVVVTVDIENSFPTRDPLDEGTSSLLIELPSIAGFAAQNITNIIYYGVIVVIDPNSNFDLASDDFERIYPDPEPYDSSEDRDYYITAGWNDNIPATFEVGDESRTTAIRSGTEEEYFNAELDNGQSYCVYVMVHSQVFEDAIIIRYTEVLCRDTRLGYNRDALISTLVIISFILLLLLVVIIVVCVCVCRRSRSRKQSERVWLVAERANTLPRRKKPPQDNVVLENISRLEEDDDLSKSAVPVVDFPDYVAKMHKNNDYLFSEEYPNVEPNHLPSKNAFTANKEKNRYLNISAYDHSRVILKHSPSGSDYINASHIGGYGKTGSFIAAQGPLPNTVGDFWCMVWEQNASVVVMLTKLEEKDRIKCHQYWPQSVEEDNTAQYGPITVKFTEELKQEHQVIRTFTLSMPGEETRCVKQYHFISWPDHGVPTDASAYLQFQDLVKREYNPLDGPMVVHCSAGVGRTGTFIAIYVQLARIAGEKTVDIYNYVRYMRRQRNLMVQNEKEYVFIHDAIVRALDEGLVAGEGVSLKKSNPYISESNF